MAIATNPFELYVDYGVRIKARSDATLTLISQLTSGSAKYLPTADAVRQGGYSAEPGSVVVAPEGGRHLVDETVDGLNRLWE